MRQQNTTIGTTNLQKNETTIPSTTGTTKPSTEKIDNTGINTHKGQQVENTHRSLNSDSDNQEERLRHLYQVRGSFTQVWQPRRGVATPYSGPWLS
jgi:hypothetical protein